MRNPKSAVSTSTREAKFVRFTIGIGLAIVAVTPLMAQTTPFQSDARARFGTGFGREELPRGGYFEPRVEAAVQYADNLTLTDLDDLQVNTAGVELAPGFYASFSGDSFLGAVDYSFIGRAWEESEFDDVTQRLAANGRWTVARDLFYIDGDAGYFETVIDPSAAGNPGQLGLFGPDSMTDTMTVAVAPTLQKQIGGFEILARYSYGRLWYLDVPDSADSLGSLGPDDSTDQAAHFAFGTSNSESDRRLSGRVFYDWNRSEYEVSLPYRYDRAGVEGGWRFTETLELVGDAGKESAVDEDTTKGGLDEDFWHAGVRWRPDDRTSAEARYGQRFFGDSYLFRIRRETRVLLFEASYQEDPTVDSVRLSASAIEPGQLQTSPSGVDFGRTTTNPYIAKDARIAVTAKGSRTELSVGVARTERDYLAGPLADEEGIGGGMTATRQFAANFSGDFEAYYWDYERGSVSGLPPVVDTARDYHTYALLRLNRAAGPRVTTSLESGYFNSGGVYDYDGWWVALRVRYVP